MRKRAARAGLIFLEALAILLAIFAAVGVFLFWRVGQGPVSLEIVKPAVEFALERRLAPDIACDIGRLTLARDKAQGAYVVRLIGVRLHTADRLAAQAETVDLAFSLDDLFSGRVGPQSIIANGASFRIVRSAAQKVEIPAAPPARERAQTEDRPRSRPGREDRLAPVLGPLTDGGLLKSAFRRGEMMDAKITFLDVASGRAWESENASVLIERNETGLDAFLRADIDMDGAAAAVSANAALTEENGAVAAEIFAENFPVGDILAMFYGDGAALINAPASGKASISFTSAGAVLKSSFDARLEDGELRLGARVVPIEYIELKTEFDPEENAFLLNRLAFDADGSRGELSGVLRAFFGDDLRDLERLSFDLEGRELTINLPGFFAAPLPVARAALAGGYDIGVRRLHLSNFDTELLGVAVSGALAAAFAPAGGADPPRSPGINARVNIDGALDPENLLKLWPVTVGSGARDWAADRLEAATIDAIEGAIALAPGAVGEDGLIPDEAMRVTFNVRDAKAHYVKGMTPLSAASGAGVLRGNSFLLTVQSGRVGAVDIAEGEVEFPVFIPKWQPTYFRFSAAGDSEDMLEVLDQEPLLLLQKINLSSEQFRGAARARIEISRPNKRQVSADEYRYSGTAQFEGMEVSGLAGDADLTNVKGEVVLAPRSLTVSGVGLLSDAPLDIVWTQNFFDEDGSSSVKLAGTVESSTADLFGVASRRYLRGPVEISATATGEIGAFQAVDLSADFSGASVNIDLLDWDKPPGAAANGRMTLSFSPDGVAVERLNIEGESVSVTGGAAFRSDGALQTANFDRFYLADAVDLSLRANRDAGDALAVTAVGDYLNIAPLLQNLFNSADSPDDGEEDAARSIWGSGVSITARIGRLAMRNSVEYNDATLDFWRDAERIETLNFSAIDGSGAPLQIEMTETGEDFGPRRNIEARSDAIGELLSGVFGVTSIHGGAGMLRMALGAPDAPGLTGQVEASGLKVVRAPLLARVFSAGSLDGLNNLLSGEGIDLGYAYGEFGVDDGVLTIKEFRANGPSVGMTAEGAIALGAGGGISLGGAVAPLYQLNSVLGNTPIIGDLFVGKKGEGLLALSYSVNGDRASPSIFVNPLSALTPGILRSLMQPQRRIPEGQDGDNDVNPGGDME